MWGAVSFTIFNEAFERNALWVSVGGYMVLGIIIAALGLGMFLKAAREKEDLRQERSSEVEGPEVGECPSTESPKRHRAAHAFSTMMLRFVPGSPKSERSFLLLWGSILGFTCLIEVSVLELGILGAVAADFGNATAGAAIGIGRRNPQPSLAETLARLLTCQSPLTFVISSSRVFPNNGNRCPKLLRYDS